MSVQPDRAAWFEGGEARCDPPAASASRPFRVVLLGPPGVGKGTQAELLCKSLGTCHLSTGDVFRAAQCQSDPSPALKAALEAMRRGELVSDGLVVSMVSERSGCRLWRRVPARRLPPHRGPGRGPRRVARPAGSQARRRAQLRTAPGRDRRSPERPADLLEVQGRLPPDREAPPERGGL